MTACLSSAQDVDGAEPGDQAREDGAEEQPGV